MARMDAALSATLWTPAPMSSSGTVTWYAKRAGPGAVLRTSAEFTLEYAASKMATRSIAPARRPRFSDSRSPRYPRLCALKRSAAGVVPERPAAFRQMPIEAMLIVLKPSSSDVGPLRPGTPMVTHSLALVDPGAHAS